HRLEVLQPCFAQRLGWTSLVQLDAGHRQHEARVHAVVAGLDTCAGARARLRPPGALAVRVAGAAQDVDDLADDGLRIAAIHVRGTGSGTDLDAAAAVRAGVHDLADALVEARHERRFAVTHRSSWGPRMAPRPPTLGRTPAKPWRAS